MRLPDEIRIVFDGPPGPESGRFVEVEDINSMSLNAGEWKERPDGLWELRVKIREPKPQKCHICNGAGAVDTPWSGSDPSCPECDGEGVIYVY